MIEDYRMLIGGAWVAASDGGTFETTNPATGKVWATAPEATAEDIDRAVKAAHEACYEGPWARMTPTERGRCLRKLGDLLADRSEALGEIETRDSGKMFKETRWQAKYIAEFFHFYAGAADKISGETLPIDKPDLFVFTNREPVGVVAAVVPWNSQLFLTAVKIGPALAAGNTVVLKTSEHAPATILEFGKLIAEAGIPDGVVNIVSGHGDPCGKVLTSHPLVARVSFTGGPVAARHVVMNSASTLLMSTNNTAVFPSGRKRSGMTTKWSRKKGRKQESQSLRTSLLRRSKKLEKPMGVTGLGCDFLFFCVSKAFRVLGA